MSSGLLVVDNVHREHLLLMAVLSALLHRPLPTTRRAYSIFSKPGGGRYFNSAKPPPRPQILRNLRSSRRLPTRIVK